ncbi:MAG: aldehyde ferredoxin oxidoreductase family protein [Candidatus Bathyarchaeia archaeon]
MYGYGGKVLLVDLKKRRHKVLGLDENFVLKWLGATGFGIKLLYDFQEPHIEPLSYGNPLIFVTGPFAGTMVPCSPRFGVFAKSPQSLLLGESYSSGFWGVELKRAGYDGLMVLGASEKPLFLYIEDEDVEFMDATHLWGATTWKTEDEIRKDLGNYDIRIASIGPAGENLVRFACIINDRYRAAGRTGLGAVMGSKKLKAIAISGSRPVSVARPEELEEKCLELYRRFQGPSTSKYRMLGTSANILTLNAAGAMPTRNYRDAVFEEAYNVSGEILNERFVSKIQACSACPMGCEHIASIQNGRFKGTTVRVEYESLWALGPYCGVGDLEAVIKAIELCDLYGMDTISSGVSIAFAMECFERGFLTEEDVGGFKLTFGNAEALLAILEAIAHRKGLGSLLAEGVRRVSQILGKGSEGFAMHVKGVEMTGYDVRGLKTSALGYAISRRGAHHQTHGAYSLDLSGKVDRFKVEGGRGELVKGMEDLYVLYDSLPLCKFSRAALKGVDEMAELYYLVTGFKKSAPDLLKTAERITNMARIYNLREGLTRLEDTLPPRIMSDPIQNGPAKGSLVKPEELELLVRDYYGARGWDCDGVPKQEKLLELGLEECDPRAKTLPRMEV